MALSCFSRKVKVSLHQKAKLPPLLVLTDTYSYSVMFLVDKESEYWINRNT